MSEKKSEGFEKQDFMEAVKEFCTSNEFEIEFDQFSNEYAEVFALSTEYKDGSEHSLAFHDAYQEFLRRFEARIENFILKKGYKVIDFYNEARAILEDEEYMGSTKFFLEALIATSEYDAFFTLMRNEAKLRAMQSHK